MKARNVLLNIYEANRILLVERTSALAGLAIDSMRLQSAQVSSFYFFGPISRSALISPGNSSLKWRSK